MPDLAAAIDGEALVEFCRSLIRTPSLSKEEEAVSELIAGEMRRLGYDEVRSDELYNVVGVLKGKGDGPCLLFNGHLDHAAPGEMADPFAARLEDGAPYGHQGKVIYGRGASDMKAGLAAMVQAGGMVKKLGLPLRGDVLVTCVAREEMARGEGIKALLDAGLRADFAVSGEASGLKVYVGHRGKMECKITTRGRTTHAAVPASGINAILKMNQLLNALQQDYRPPGHEFLGDCTWTVLDIEASPGALTPVVPDRCQAIFDRRFLPEESQEELLAGFQDFLDRLAASDPEFSAEIELLKWFPAMFTDPGSPVVQAMLGARQKILGSPGKPGAWHFGVDGTFLNQAGIPCVGFGPGNEHLAHTPKDVVPVSHLVPACAVYLQLIMDLCA